MDEVEVLVYYGVHDVDISFFQVAISLLIMLLLVADYQYILVAKMVYKQTT